MELFINLRSEPYLTLLNAPQLENIAIWFGAVMIVDLFIYLTDKVDEPERTTAIRE